MQTELYIIDSIAIVAVGPDNRLSIVSLFNIDFGISYQIMTAFIAFLEPRLRFVLIHVLYTNIKHLFLHIHIFLSVSYSYSLVYFCL